MINKILPILSNEQKLRLGFYINSTLFLLYKKRAINILRQSYLNLKTTLTLILESLNYLQNKNDYSVNILELKTKLESNLLNTYIDKEIKNLSFLKANAKTRTESLEDIYDCINLLTLLENDINELKTNITNNVEIINIDDIKNFIKDNVVSNLEQDISVTSLLNNLLSLKNINNLVYKNPMDFISNEIEIEGVDILAKSSSTTTFSPNYNFSISIGSTNYNLTYPVNNASGAYIIGNKTIFQIPSTSSFYIELTMKPGFDGPKQIGLLPTGVIKIDLTQGTRTLNQIITELNNGFLYLDVNNVNTQFCTAEQFGTTGTIVMHAPNCTQLKIIPVVPGDPARISAHKELGFEAYKISGFEIIDFFNFLINKGVPALFFNNIITIFSDKDIIINSGIGVDLGFLSTKALPIGYTPVLDLSPGDELYVLEGTLIIKNITDYMYMNSNLNISKQIPKINLKLVLELKRIINYLNNLNLDIKKIKELTQNIIERYTIDIERSLKILIVDMLSKIDTIVLILKMDVTLTTKQLNLIKNMDQLFLDSKFDLGLKNFNRGNFNFNELISQDKLLESMEVLGRELNAGS